MTFNFGTKAKRRLAFGAKIVGGVLNFGAKVARKVSNTVGTVANVADRVLSIAEVIPGVRAIDAPLRAAVNVAQGVASTAGQAADFLGVASTGARALRDTLEKKS